METLFKQVEKEKKLKNAPLAVRMRPSTLDEYVGQRKAVGPGSCFVPPLSMMCFPT